MNPTKTEAGPRPWRRRWLWLAPGMLVLLPIAGVLALPWALSTRPGRDWLLTRANRVLAPSALRIEGLSLSWTRPTTVRHLTLIDENGRRAVESPTVTWNRNLYQILFDRPALGTVVLERPGLLVRRHPDGTINLAETLRPIISGDPRTSLRVEIRDGRLRVEGQGAMAPVVAEHADLTVTIDPVPGPVTWIVQLANGEAPRPRESLNIRGHLNRKADGDDLDLKVAGQAWPISVGSDRALLDGSVSANRDGGRWTSTGDLRVRAEALEGETIGVRFKGSAPGDLARIDLASLAVQSRFIQAEASGRIDDPGRQSLLDLRGNIAPAWDRINEWLRREVEPAATLKGRDHPFRLSVRLQHIELDRIDGEIGLALESADLYGLKIGPTALVVRAREGQLAIDPIEATINEGRLHLEPKIENGDDRRPSAIVLDRASTLTAAKVNDEVSRRVLSFAAPVLDHATSVRGEVSATIDRAVFPLRERDKGPTIEGAVVFRGVEFLPGPWLDDLFDLIGKADRPTLRLDQPVALTVADRKVTQHGLSVPIGNLTHFELDGSVGFDRSLDLTAAVPILPDRLADRPLLAAVAADARVKVPIRGTLQHPQIDREAFKEGMNDLGRSLLERGGLMGAAGLIERLTRPRDPNAPPPPTAAERRELRQERREERKMRRRGMIP